MRSQERLRPESSQSNTVSDMAGLRGDLDVTEPNSVPSSSSSPLEVRLADVAEPIPRPHAVKIRP